MSLRDFDALDEQNVEKNNQLAFDIAEKELGISPIMTGKEMASVGEPDKLSMVMYLTQFYEMFKDSLPSSGELRGGVLASCCPCSREASRSLLHPSQQCVPNHVLFSKSPSLCVCKASVSEAFLLNSASFP